MSFSYNNFFLNFWVFYCTNCIEYVIIKLWLYKKCTKERSYEKLKSKKQVKPDMLCMAVMILTAGICAIKGLNDVRNHADEVLEEAVRVDYDESIKEEVENAISVLDQYNAEV